MERLFLQAFSKDGKTSLEQNYWRGIYLSYMDKINLYLRMHIIWKTRFNFTIELKQNMERHWTVCRSLWEWGKHFSCIWYATLQFSVVQAEKLLSSLTVNGFSLERFSPRISGEVCSRVHMLQKSHRDLSNKNEKGMEAEPLPLKTLQPLIFPCFWSLYTIQSIPTENRVYLLPDCTLHYLALS